MQVTQWEDKNLAQYSYGILSDGEKKVVLIDPARNPQPYLDYAKTHNAEIIGIIETHPHADFVSGHLELHQLTGAVIYTHSQAGAAYPHTAFDEGDTIAFGNIRLTAHHTPGHSPDSITIVLEHEGNPKAVFTGDTLFIGDCGRPDLREGAGNVKGTRQELAIKMYHSLRNTLMPLPNDVVLYPGHGAGTLCGKELSNAASSTIGQEKETNWCLQPMTKHAFVQTLLQDQPFIPAYFPYNVEVNRKGAAPFKESIAAVETGKTVKTEKDAERFAKDVWVVDARPEKKYKKGHLPRSINLMEDSKFETWLGSVIQPEEPFYLAGESTEQLQHLIERAAAIGYEPQIRQAFILEKAAVTSDRLDIAAFKKNLEGYTIVDVRNEAEVKEAKFFKNSIAIPLADLRQRINELPTDKPVVVHCAGGYRSAAASSIIKSMVNGKVDVLDLGEAVTEFQRIA